MWPQPNTVAGHDRYLAAVDLLRRNEGEIESVVRGDSMGPTLPAGARIRVACSQRAAFADGAVVAFLAGDVMIGHRVVGRCHDRQGREALLIRGDARLLCDPPVDPALVLGEVIAWQQGSVWHPVAPAPRRGPVNRLAAAAVLGWVRLLARFDLPRVARWHEWVLATLIRVRARLAALFTSHG